MPPVSRPLFDWSDDSPAPRRGRRADDEDAPPDPDDEADDQDADDEEADDESGAALDADADDDDALDDEFPLGDGVAENAATVWCPYCGEASEVAVDPGGGEYQEYVEDCPVCCRPWRVTVRYQPDGTVDAYAQTDDE